MSYNGTVRCGHCYETGHNKRSCKKLTEALQSRAASENDPDGYWTRQYVKRTGLNPDGTEAPKEAKAKQVRRCKYCGATGHNRRTCEVLKRDIAEAVRENKEFRANLLNSMREAGLGVGALVKGGWRGETRVVTGIRWDHMNYRSVRSNAVSPLLLSEIRNPRQQEEEYLPRMEHAEESWGRDRCEVISPISGSAVDATMPADWLNGRSGIKERFDASEIKSQCYWDNYYDRS
jgi:hypothetical protein